MSDSALGVTGRRLSNPWPIYTVLLPVRPIGSTDDAIWVVSAVRTLDDGSVIEWWVKSTTGARWFLNRYEMEMWFTLVNRAEDDDE